MTCQNLTDWPDRLEKTLARLGANWNDDINGHRAAVIELYRPKLERAPQSPTVSRDLPYGDDPAQRLDVFSAISGCVKSELRPVVVFVHGGAFTRGSKSDGSLVYDNVLHWFARQGFVGVNVEYRLAPAIQYPDGARDVSAALSWITNNIARFGGDPARILLIGHSAGGSHVASCLFAPEVGLPPCPGVRGAVLISARLRADMLPDNPNAANVAAYFGTDPEVQDRHSPVRYAGSNDLPVMLAVAEFENRHLDTYAAEFAALHALRRGAAPRLMMMPRHNHTSIVVHFNTDDDVLGREILDFANRECGLSACSFCKQGAETP